MDNDTKTYCQYCGSEIKSEELRCSNCGKQSPYLPKELHKFNWGAFLLNWIWGIMHDKYITLLFFPANIIPVIGPFILCIWFGIKGNEWAWNAKTWNSIEEFNKNQRFWVKLWIILFVLGTIILLKIWIFLTILGLASID